MAIYTPGKRFRYHNILGKKSVKRETVALLSLTAMVDMFTVLVIFLLQNYNTEGLFIQTPEDMILPKAQVVKELKPAIVVTIGKDKITVDNEDVIETNEVRAQRDWVIQALLLKVQAGLDTAKQKAESELLKEIRKSVKPSEDFENQEKWRKVTVQSDKGIEFITVKKVIHTLTEAGAGEINFAVIKNAEEIENATSN